MFFIGKGINYKGTFYEDYFKDYVLTFFIDKL